MTRRSDSGDRYMMLALDLSREEVACLIFESLTNAKRPKGMTATEALDLQPLELQDGLRRGANSVLQYVGQQINAATIHETEKQT